MGFKEGKYLFLIAIVSPMLWSASSKTEKQDILEEEIAVLNRVLDDNEVATNSILGEITNLEYQVLAAQKIVHLIENKEQASEASILRLENQLATLELQKKNAVVQLQKLLLEEYKHRDYKKKLYFLASSSSINQFVNRLNHLGKLKDFRTKQLSVLLNKSAEIRDRLAIFKGTEQEKTSLTNRKFDELVKLNDLLRLKHKKFNDLRQAGNQVKLEMNEKRKQLKLFNNQVAKHIVKTKKNQIKFNRKLKWPVKNGLLVNRFGVKKHNKERKVRVENNGIDILVSAEEAILTVDDGTVKAVIEVPGSNTSVIIDHGTFYSVYSNLKGTHLKQGEQVKQGVKLASVGKDTDGLRKLHFELWQGINKLNPEKYLKGKLN